MSHHVIRAVILTAFAMFIVYLVRTDQIMLYIAPRMLLYVKLSAVGLYAAAIYQVYAALQKRMGRSVADCGCEHDHALESPPASLKNTLIYGLFIFPLLLGFLLPNATLGSAEAARKGMSLTSTDFVNRTGPGPGAASGAAPLHADSNDLDAMFPYDEYTKGHAELGKQLYEQPVINVSDKQFIETLTTLDLYRRPLIGKTVELTGFVYREEAMPSNQFVVSRFAMNCCSADALPYGVIVELDNAARYADDQWVRVSGILGTTTYQENEVIKLDVTTIQQAIAPESPYVYADLDFGL
ncbi:TIGR03943 family putative permease subunit [Paenibacillus sp. GCM10023252]|uniref:TIGR03943 family putative permease subunit n=1 Tax=Paenibacillus sp. GCM10023252 TaxID=3252649 RepID=UPI0036147251